MCEVNLLSFALSSSCFLIIQQYDTESIQGAIPEGTQLEFTFIDALLDSTTATLSAGYQAVCLFVNDVCDAGVIEKLHESGVVRAFASLLITIPQTSKPRFVVFLCAEIHRITVCRFQ